MRPIHFVPVALLFVAFAFRLVAERREALYRRVFWQWGTLATWALRNHLKTELAPYAKYHGHGREETYAACESRLRRLFEAAWPE